MSTLVIYFSQTGTTKAVAEKIAEIKKADLIEINPEKPYKMTYWMTIGRPIWFAYHNLIQCTQA